MAEPQPVDQPVTLFTALLLSAVAVLVFNVEPIYLGVLQEHRGLDPSQLGLLVGAEIGGIGFASVAAVFWVRRISWRRAMLFGVAVLIVGNLASAFVEQFTELLTLRGLVGFFGAGTLFAVVNTLFGDTRVPARTFALSIFSQVGLGMLGLLVFPAVAAEWGYAGVLVGMTIPAVLGAFLLGTIPHAGSRSPDTVVGGAAVSVLPVFVGLAVMLAWFAGLSSLWAFLERIGVEAGFSHGSVGQLLAAGMGLGALSSLVVSVIGNRFGRLWQPAFSIAAHLVLALLVVRVGAQWVYVAAVLSFTLIWNIGLPYLLGGIAAADVQGRLLVLLVAAQAMGNTAGPIIGGYIAEDLGFRAVGYNCALFSLVALLLYSAFATLLRRRRLLPD